MTGQLQVRTMSVSVFCSADRVYEFVSDLRNLPVWAPAFARSIEQVGEKWILQTDQGPLEIRICAENSFGVLDHYVSPSPGVEMYVPMRVIANGTGSEVLFTLLQTSDMSDERFAQDCAAVRRDLESLKKVLEK